MAKARPQSVRSRAARRAASPSLDLDKSLTSLPRAEQTVIERESIHNDRINAGVSKKSKTKPKSRAQKLRQQKGVERAEIVFDQLEKKVAHSVIREKTVKSRRAEWEDLNRKALGSMFQALQADDELDEAMADATKAPKTKKSVSKQASTAQNPVVDEHADIDVDDDIT